MSTIENISLFIPRVDMNRQGLVQEVFEKHIGSVKNVDFVLKESNNGQTYYAAYIHFHEWYDTPDTHKFQDLLLSPEKEATIEYECPWYWIVLVNTGKKRTQGQRKAAIDLSVFGGAISQTNNAKLLSHVVSECGTPSSTQLNTTSEDRRISQEDIDVLFEEMKEGEMMRQLEHEIDEEDKHIALFDSRYVKTIEEENAYLRSQVNYFNNLYTSETVKSMALLEAISVMKRIEIESAKK